MRGGATRCGTALLAGLALFTCFDYGMRADQRALCQRGDSVLCPAHMSIWGEVIALGGVR